MYKFIKIRHDIIKQCHGNYKEIKKFNYKVEIDIVNPPLLSEPFLSKGRSRLADVGSSTTSLIFLNSAV